MNACHILGVGGIGTLFGVYLSNQFKVIPHLRSSTILPFKSLDGRISTVKTESDTQTPIPLLIATTKAHDTLHAIMKLSDRLTTGSTVILLQNGVLGVYDELKRHFENRESPIFVLGSVTHGITRTADACIHTGDGIVYLGPCNDMPLPINTLDILNQLSSIPNLNINIINCYQEMKQKLIIKLVINSCINSLGSIYNISNGKLLSKYGESLIQDLVSEAFEIVRDELLGLSRAELLMSVTDVVKKTSNNYNSMAMDIQFKRKTEVDYLIGHLILMGRSKSVISPKLEFLLDQLKFKIHLEQS